MQHKIEEARGRVGQGRDDARLAKSYHVSISTISRLTAAEGP
jgi:hypothetical protein